MIKINLTIIFLLFITNCLAQENITITGKVIDAKTGQPLINASIGIIDKPYGASSDLEGNFGLLVSKDVLSDTLFVSYVGYQAFTDRVSNLDLDNLVFKLEESAHLLEEVTITGVKFEYKLKTKKFERSMKLIKGNLYAFKTEVTKKEYNHFLNYLQRSNQMDLYHKYKPVFSQYEGSLLAFFKGYHTQYQRTKDRKFDKNFDDYPIVNISQEAALAYCEWLTNLYNTGKGKKKFRRANFRLPTLKEWQIAALGSRRFQSWNLEENEVLVGIPEHPGEEVSKKRRPIPVKGNDILYPWFHVYEYRNKAQNNNNCWLGNFKVPPGSTSCQTFYPNGDGFAVTSKVSTYFPNGMGLYDMVGNVAEMIDEEGKACGGSWDHLPEESTIASVNSYSEPSGAVGFRVFMEIQIPEEK